VRLILVRHYKTAFNVSGHIIGWGDSEPVEESGEDLRWIEEILAARRCRPHAVYSSALVRARRTARYFADTFALGDASAASQLNEINYGVLQSKSKRWVREHYPQYKTDVDFVFPQGESFRQMQRRSTEFLQSLLDRREHDVAMCVTHAGVIRAVVSRFLELDFSGQLQRRISHRYIGVLDFDDVGAVTYAEWGASTGFLED
jgi:broad specificity phosphatase PhoE